MKIYFWLLYGELTLGRQEEKEGGNQLQGFFNGPGETEWDRRGHGGGEKCSHCLRWWGQTWMWSVRGWDFRITFRILEVGGIRSWDTLWVYGCQVMILNGMASAGGTDWEKWVVYRWALQSEAWRRSSSECSWESWGQCWAVWSIRGSTAFIEEQEDPSKSGASQKPVKTFWQEGCSPMCQMLPSSQVKMRIRSEFCLWKDDCC